MKITFRTKKSINFEQEFEINGKDHDGYRAKISVDECNRQVWTTCMSQFNYTQTSDKEFVYKGARNGFLKQNLIPDFGDVEILRIEGTYGIFQGPESMERYRDASQDWFEKCEPILNYADEELGINSNYEGMILATLYELKSLS